MGHRLRPVKYTGGEYTGSLQRLEL
jgi:hypothetical protein